MERISNSLPATNQQITNGSQQLTTSSASIPPRQSLGISQEKINAMLAVLNKRWLTNGWRIMNPEDSETMALAFIECLNMQNIPHEHYQELYRRSVELRARRLEQGLKTEDFSVDLMLAAWPALKAEIRERDIAAGIRSTAASDCDLCYGAGMRNIDGNGFGKCECVGG